MSEGRRNVARVAVAAGGITLLGVALFAVTRDRPVEPQGVRPGVARDAGPGGDEEKPDAAIGRTISRYDGAVQIHLPPEATPVHEVLGPEEMRARRQAQLALIEQRIEELEEDLEQAPDDTVIRGRIDHLRERRDTLRRLLSGEEPEEAPPPRGL